MAEWATRGSNLFRREMRLERAGDVVPGHGHFFGHDSDVRKGVAKFEQLEPIAWAPDLNAPTEFAPPGVDEYGPFNGKAIAWKPDFAHPVDFKVLNTVVRTRNDPPIVILAGVWHRITAMEDDTLVHCLYANRTAQSRKLTREQITEQLKAFNAGKDAYEAWQIAQGFAMRDASGALWMKVDESVVHDYDGYQDAYE